MDNPKANALIIANKILNNKSVVGCLLEIKMTTIKPKKHTPNMPKKKTRRSALSVGLVKKIPAVMLMQTIDATNVM